MENGAGENKIKYEQLIDMGSGLVVAKLPLSSLREQDINARIMKTEMQKQLTENIKKRGQLESLPLCILKDGRVEIISGHHRIRSAKDSGIFDTIFVILDTSGLSRSQIVAKQLAHNAISGFDDENTLKQLTKMLTDVDDMIESYIGKDILGEPNGELEKLLSPKLEFDWKNITFTFLPHQLKDLDKLIEALEKTSPDFVGFASEDEYKPFVETIAKYQSFSNVKNTGTAVHAMITATEQILDNVDFSDGKEFIQLSSIFGASAIEKEKAEVLKGVVDGIVKEKGLRNKAETLEILALNYLEQ